MTCVFVILPLGIILFTTFFMSKSCISYKLLSPNVNPLILQAKAFHQLKIMLTCIMDVSHKCVITKYLLLFSVL